MISEIIFIILGIGIGTIAAGLVMRYRNNAKIIELEGRAKAGDGLITELRSQLKSKEDEINEIRTSLASEQKIRVEAETRFDEAKINLEEQKNLLSQAEEKLKSTFQALSGDALKSNNKAFLDLAKQTLDTVLKEAQGDMGKKEIAIKAFVQPLQESLARYEKQIKEFEEKRNTDYGSLDTQIKSLLKAEQDLQKETNNLVTALRRPEVKGNWGQIALRRVVELSGMSEKCDFTEQVSVDMGDGRLIPDMIVHLPANREIVVDSKVSTNAFLEAISAETESERRSFLKKHALQVRTHMKTLASKSYWSQFQKAPEFVVMFLPGEALLNAALREDISLYEDGLKENVIITTSVNLFALLRTIAYGWRQEQITKNAQEVAKLAKELYERFQPFIEHTGKTGKALEDAVSSFNKMVTSLESRVLVSVRRFKELGVAVDGEIPALEQVEQIPLKKSE